MTKIEIQSKGQVEQIHQRRENNRRFEKVNEMKKTIVKLQSKLLTLEKRAKEYDKLQEKLLKLEKTQKAHESEIKKIKKLKEKK